MAVGYRNAAGVDFDDLFDFYSGGPVPPAVGLRDAAGNDIGPRYNSISVGSKGPDVGFRSSAIVDVSNYWAAKGSSSFSISGFSGKSLNAADNAVTLQPTVQASVGFTFSNAGTWSVTGGNSGGGVSQPAPTNGTWNTFGGTAADYDILIEVLSDTGSAARQLNFTAGWQNLGTSRGATFLLPSANANNANERTGNASLRIRIRRVSTGAVVSDNTLNMNISTRGYA